MQHCLTNLIKSGKAGFRCEFKVKGYNGMCSNQFLTAAYVSGAHTNQEDADHFHYLAAQPQTPITASSQTLPREHKPQLKV